MCSSGGQNDASAIVFSHILNIPYNYLLTSEGEVKLCAQITIFVKKKWQIGQSAWAYRGC